jgi:redox-sensitive bicupin YhaK (pirin superfamily)
VVHSENNASTTEPVHFLQIWILPRKGGLPAGYEQKTFSDDEKRGRLRLVASPDGAEGSVVVQQDVRLYAALLEPGQSVSHAFGRGRTGWLQVARGAAAMGSTALEEGDGVAIEREPEVELRATAAAELLLFELPC